MRTTQAARYARWSAILAGILLLIVAGAYLRRVWQARQAEKLAPPPVPASVEQRSAEFSFSKTVGDRTLFTVRASRATEFKKGDRSLLEDVWITAYGDSGKRFDNLRTHSCDYVPTSGEIRCAGPVQIDLQSASDAQQYPLLSGRPNPAAHILHVGTSQVSFNRATGVAISNAPVQFTFPEGNGRASGIRYESGQGRMELLHDVHVTLHPAGTPNGAARSSEIRITGSSMVYGRDQRVLRLLGPVTVDQGTRQLRAGELEVELGVRMRARRMVATGHPEAQVEHHGAPLTVSADQFSLRLSADGRIKRVAADGNVRSVSKTAEGETRLAAEHVEEENPGGGDAPGRLTASGNVAVTSARAGGASWRLTAPHVAVAFRRPGEAETPRPGSAVASAATLVWEGPQQAAGGSRTQHLRLTAQTLKASFWGENQLRELRGTNGVEVVRQIGEAEAVTSRSRELVARFVPGGEWSKVEQSGDVRLRAGDRNAQATHASFDRAEDTVVLDGDVTLSDQTSRTAASTAVFHEASGKFQARGGVVTSEIGADGDEVANFGMTPAHISADRMTADTAEGRAVYSGHARLWQGDTIIEADRMEVDSRRRTLKATGHVLGNFPKARWAPPSGSTLARADGANASLRAEAGRLIYHSDEGHAVLDQGAAVQTSEGSIRSDSMRLFFGPVKPIRMAADEPSGGRPATAITPSGGRELERVEASGNVEVEEDGRRATAAHGEYTAAEGKFVLSGGHPTIYDDSGNAATGRQLTFFFADDRIVIDSDEGSRTLTLHRVER